MNEHSNRFFVLTGGPGSGKTTLIDALRDAGHACSTEAGRGVIKAQVAIGGDAVPWGDRAAFAELMLGWEMRSHDMAREMPGPVFFDRGVPDVVGYLRLENLPVPAHAERAAELYRYSRRVFMAPPWPEIFTQDRERKQSFEEALRTYEMMAETYAARGYDLVELPCAPVEERLRFVLEAIRPG